MNLSPAPVDSPVASLSTRGGMSGGRDDVHSEDQAGV